ncbi:MAG: DUF512 domain-containing protein [Oscillospiraceae bacterium]|nr:DUF512 domain-containing protein [Oscillospiraceae bacterium]
MKNNKILKIDDASPLQGKVSAGDCLLSINGNRILDVLDYKFFAYDRHLHLELQSEDGSIYSLHVEKDEGGDLGLDFESYLMDAPRSCANNCVFCFIDQLPSGMRPTMYFKDDDARLSFLLGNYITLTNLSEREVQRIISLHVSPVNVSVHTTDPELRCRMLRNPHAARGLEILRRFAAGGIQMNCQIVCCPGLNDGKELERTMRDLAQLYPQVNSVSIVPVGLTKFREGLYPLTPFTPELAEKTIDEVTAFGDECLARYGSRIFFCGDELYLKCGREIPPDVFYEDYVQLENGVGMLRLMETEFSSALTMSEMPEKEQRFSLATGVAAAPFFQNLVCNAQEKYDTIKGQVYPIVNDFFGRSIDVAGLITGGDLIAQLKGKELGERLLISHNMIRREERDFLDDVTLQQASEELGVPIYPIEEDGFALWDAMSGEVLPELPGAKGKKTEDVFYRYNQNR